MKRPDYIKNFLEIQELDNASYPDSNELLSIGSPFGKLAGLQRIGIHHELLLPGRRTSYPHAESTEEEFVYVIEGNPDVWLDGEIYTLNPGDGVSFPAGTGISHTFINNSKSNVRLLVVGEKRPHDNKVYYPLNHERKSEVNEMWWDDVPKKPLGNHNGLPD